MEAGAPPDPMTLHPVAVQPRVVLLKPLITSPLIEVGEFSYYDDPEFAPTPAFLIPCARATRKARRASS